MMLNRLNVWTKNGKIQYYTEGRTGVPVFFPVKWQIDWSFDSLEPTTPSYFRAFARIEFIFNWLGYSENGGITSDLEANIFKKTLTDTHNSSRCEYELKQDLSFVSVELTSTTGEQPFTASGRIQFVADHFHFGNLLKDMEAISDYAGTVRQTLPSYYKNAEFTYNVTMLES